MGLRLHFTAVDLARLRVLTEPDPMWELVLSLPVLCGRAPNRYEPWRRHALRAVEENDLRLQVHTLGTLVAPLGDFPDFLTPSTTSGFEAAVEAVLGTPRGRLRRELDIVFARRSAPSWVHALASGERLSMESLGDAIIRYRRDVIEPFEPQVRGVVTLDRERRAHDVLTGGAERLLTNLPKPIEWRPPVLQTAYPRDRDLHLDGRGLTLIPSYFCWGTPVTFIDSDLPPVLVYPAAHARASVGDDIAGLGDLIGATRARALVSLRRPSSTTELAARSGMSVTSASKHTAVLREAGLITSSRRGNAVIHSLTRLGRDLLDNHGGGTR